MRNIIGGIHGLDSWKQLVREETMHIFVGDYVEYPGQGLQKPVLSSRIQADIPTVVASSVSTASSATLDRY